MRPRLAFLRDLAADLAGAARTRRRVAQVPSAPAHREEERSAEEMKRRLDETRARLKQQHPPVE